MKIDTCDLHVCWIFLVSRPKISNVDANWKIKEKLS